jgi:hypothetical protein
MASISLRMGGTEVANIDQLIDLMQKHRDRFEKVGDHRGAFLRVYASMTSGVRDKLTQRFFLDPEWIERVAIRFAWWYFDALDRYERGEDPPPAWHFAFETARKRSAFILQDIFLGMNAHINNDLPRVVAQILRDEQESFTFPRSIKRRFDHDQINRVLQMVIPSVEAEIAQSGGRLIRPLARIMGSLDQGLAGYGLKTYRDNVWRNSQFLLTAETNTEIERVLHFIEMDALGVAKQIVHLPVLRWFRPLAPLMRRWRLG